MTALACLRYQPAALLGARPPPPESEDITNSAEVLDKFPLSQCRAGEAASDRTTTNLLPFCGAGGPRLRRRIRGHYPSRLFDRDRLRSVPDRTRGHGRAARVGGADPGNRADGSAL